ncbi:glycosyltransferase [Microbacterium rhizomatis]|uniref:Glycosyltransferase family 4 protein n=1 Tax=Microbacterium rhizomatis TaxID=1631477 RepID=A0A5J5J0E1_9MICO|nr:glycosyltransferase [Microbacterium rhizomatis]KAA9107797.1 glycosyltransferase family 4 protein [Microbacterium rhizomatis]
MSDDIGAPAAISKVFLVVETSPSAQAPGKARRHAHIVAWLADRDQTTESLSLLPETVRNAGLIRRFLGVLLGLPGVIRHTRRGDTLYFLGLGEVHLLMAAAITAIFGRTVIYDACDSWVLQLAAREEAGAGARAFMSRAGAALQRIAPRRLAVSYISARDADADRAAGILARRAVHVIPPMLPETLRNLPEVVRGRVDRIVAGVDMRSFHNLSGFEELREGWESIRAENPGVVLELFGLGLPEVIAEGVIVRGWAPSLSELYVGNTAVFITNQGGSGVPNKLVEAVAARRPVVIHHRSMGLVEPGPWVFPYETNLAEQLSNLLRLELEPDASNYPRLAASMGDDSGSQE